MAEYKGNDQGVIYDNRLAKNYNEYHSQDEHLFKLQIEKISNYLNLNTETSIVADAGCGAGRLIPAMSEKANAVHGIELSPNMAQEAMELTKNHGKVVIINKSWGQYVQDFLETRREEKGFKYSYDGIYFSMSLHQMGTKPEQHKILNETKKILDIHGKILLITVSHRQFEQILLNKFFPTLDEMDRERFIDVSELRLSHAVSSVEEHTVYKRYEKQVFLDMLENKYISSLQMISSANLYKGIDEVEKMYKTSSHIIAPDCYTYVTIEK